MNIPVGFAFYRDLIVQIAGEFDLDPYLVAAVVWQESSFNTDAYRFEPGFWNRYLKKNPTYAKLNPRRVSASYGLCQVMYPLVLEDQVADNDALPPEHLFVPEHGLRTGCRHLQGCLKWAASHTTGTIPASKVVESALAGYNGGRSSDNRPTSPTLRNGAYARDALSKYIALKQQRVFDLD